MAYVSVSEWRPEQVTEWLKGLDNCVLPYLHWFLNNEVNGQQLLNLSPDELTHLGVHKLGHQELILEGVQHLRNFHYELDRENLQLLALRLSCASHSLYNEIRDQAESSCVSTQIMADVANVVNTVKPLVSWLDRPPFSGQIEYSDYKTQLLSLSLEMATCAQRDRFAERPVAEIRTCSSKLAKLADSIVQDIADPMLLQPSTLDLATIKKRVGEDLGFFLMPSFHGIHQIGDMKLSSPAHQSGKIQQGDEVVQVNYQTVVGWSRKKVLALFEESPNDLLLTLKRRPRHVKIYGQIYMKPYRLPSRKRASPYSRWNDNLPSPRPELLTIPHFDLSSKTVTVPEKTTNEFLNNSLLEPSVTSSSSDEEFGQPVDSQSPTSMRIYLPKPRAPIQRRFTLSGPPRPSAQSEQFWRELQLERSWRSNQNNSQMNHSESQNLEKSNVNIDERFQLRDKSASFGNSIATAPVRPATCMPFTKDRIGTVKFDVPKKELRKEQIISEEKDKGGGDNKSHDKSASVESSCSAMNGNANTKLSISELNKLKRDAFFNNMDCSTVQNSAINNYGISSEKIVKSDMKIEEDGMTTPGKVMQLIGSFERKEIEQKTPTKKMADSVKKEIHVREKGRLDKSCSTPAYDLTESEPHDFIEQKKDQLELSKAKNMSDDEVLKQRRQESEKESHGQMVNTINDHLLPDGDLYGKMTPKQFADESTAYKSRFDDDEKFDYKLRKTGEILDTVNLALVELEQREDHYERREAEKEQKSPKKDFFADIPPAPREIRDIKKPVPAQRKLKLPPEKNEPNCCPGPLPPKPRPRPLPPSPDGHMKPPLRSRTPPEPPPRPESTFQRTAKPEKVSEECLSVSEAFRKGNIFISGPLMVTPQLNTTSPSIYEAKHVVPEREAARSSAAPVLIVTTEREKPKPSGSGTLESLKAMLTLGRKPLSFSSPRSVRKKNALLAKRRNVSVKDLSPCDNAGNLCHRNRKGSAMASWTKGYFVLQGSNFYGFKSRESHKADLFVHLPGFTCSVAEEVKSKMYPFKIYHTGTVFYFAADTEEDLQHWLDCVTLATICQDDKPVPDTVTFSETDSDRSDTEPEPETCFPTSPKMKKFLGSSPIPKPARSHQNLASDSKKSYDLQKKFGSLKKFSSQKHSSNNNSPNPLGESANVPSSEVASLDRKYLRFLGQKNAPIPVPTSQFRSYRRMQPPPTQDKGSGGLDNIENIQRNVVAHPNVRDQPRLTRRTLHSSNPSLIHPDMADYRITQERLAEFRRIRNEERPTNLRAFMTLEQFMLSRQEEERAMRNNRPRPPDMSGFMTLEQFMLQQEEERQRSSRVRERPVDLSGFMTLEQFLQRQEEERQRSGRHNRTRVYPSGAPAVDNSSCKTSLESPRGRNHNADRAEEKPQVIPRTTAPSAKSSSMKLKNAAQYRPPPMPHSPSSPNQSDEPMFMAFEMALDQSSARKKSLAEAVTPPECLGKEPIPDYPGIEYPPAFEPETYTLQYMLKNRRKRNANKNK